MLAGPVAARPSTLGARRSIERRHSFCRRLFDEIGLVLTTRSRTEPSRPQPTVAAQVLQNVPPGPAAAILARLPVDVATAIALGLDPFTAAAVLDGLDALAPANATAGANNATTATTVPAILGRLPAPAAAAVLEHLPPAVAAAALAGLNDPAAAGELLARLPPATAAAIVDEMDVAVAAQVLETVAPLTAAQILRDVAPERADALRERLPAPVAKAVAVAGVVAPFGDRSACVDPATPRNDLAPVLDAKTGAYEVRRCERPSPSEANGRSAVLTPGTRPRAPARRRSARSPRRMPRPGSIWSARLGQGRRRRRVGPGARCRVRRGLPRRGAPRPGGAGGRPGPGGV